jgi:hypothetical protein
VSGQPQAPRASCRHAEAVCSSRARRGARPIEAGGWHSGELDPLHVAGVQQPSRMLWAPPAPPRYESKQAHLGAGETHFYALFTPTLLTRIAKLRLGGASFYNHSEELLLCSALVSDYCCPSAMVGGSLAAMRYCLEGCAPLLISLGALPPVDLAHSAHCRVAAGGRTACLCSAGSAASTAGRRRPLSALSWSWGRATHLCSSSRCVCS